MPESAWRTDCVVLVVRKGCSRCLVRNGSSQSTRANPRHLASRILPDFRALFVINTLLTLALWQQYEILLSEHDHVFLMFFRTLVYLTRAMNSRDDLPQNVTDPQFNSVRNERSKKKLRRYSRLGLISKEVFKPSTEWSFLCHELEVDWTWYGPSGRCLE